jgi:hypothetical protein
MTATQNEEGPGNRDWSLERLRVPPRDDKPIIAFVQTSHGIARVSLSIVDPYSLASGLLQWVVVPPTDPVFLAAPTDLQADWTTAGLRVRWTETASRYLIEVISGEQRRKEITGQPEILLPDLDRNGVHRILVRGLIGGAISVPGTITQHGSRRAAVRTTIEYGDRWYNDTGGLRLSDGKVASDDAEVVFYLYGVSVPGGGVQQIGSGKQAFHAQSTLPDSGYLPNYGRIDENDVLAVRLADGRFGLLYLEATDGGDVRSGMKVHTVFLPDGRRNLLAAPNPTAKKDAQVTTVSWNAVPGAELYRVAVADQPVITTTETSVRLDGLVANQLHEVAVSAHTKAGDASSEQKLLVHSFAFEMQIGTCTLEMQSERFEFATGTFGKQGLGLIGGTGSGQGLSFEADGMIVGVGSRTFGDLQGIEPPTAGKSSWYSDHRKPDSEAFLVFPKTGGCAMVRITLRGYPSQLEYLWVPKLSDLKPPK